MKILQIINCLYLEQESTLKDIESLQYFCSKKNDGVIAIANVSNKNSTRYISNFTVLLIMLMLKKCLVSFNNFWEYYININLKGNY